LLEKEEKEYSETNNTHTLAKKEVYKNDLYPSNMSIVRIN